MVEGLAADYVARMEWEYRKAVLLPLAARQDGWRRELRLVRRAAPASLWKALVSRLGGWSFARRTSAIERGVVENGSEVRADVGSVPMGTGAQGGA